MNKDKYNSLPEDLQKFLMTQAVKRHLVLLEAHGMILKQKLEESSKKEAEKFYRLDGADEGYKQLLTK